MSKEGGMCYRDAWRYAMGQDDAYLVHGRLISPLDNKIIDHAWVEWENHVWEPQTQQIFRKSEFNQVFKPIVYARYTKHEAARLAVRMNHYGPWTTE